MFTCTGAGNMGPRTIDFRFCRAYGGNQEELRFLLRKLALLRRIIQSITSTRWPIGRCLRDCGETMTIITFDVKMRTGTSSYLLCLVQVSRRTGKSNALRQQRAFYTPVRLQQSYNSFLCPSLQ
jgi:hypothetical protein